MTQFVMQIGVINSRAPLTCHLFAGFQFKHAILLKYKERGIVSVGS